jgi:hypothetical protein
MFRLPDLEKEGIVEIIPAHQPLGVQPISTKWKRGKLGSRGRPPKALLAVAFSCSGISTAGHKPSPYSKQ